MIHLHTRPFVRQLLICAAVAVVMVPIVKNAWICDDAYITFRTVDNFLNGFGLRWNPTERVQTFTHPLWMFLIVGACCVTSEFYYTVSVLSMGIALFSLVLLFCARRMTLPTAALVCLALVGSRAFVDFSTSGLENTAAHLLAALFLRSFLGNDTPRTSAARLFLFAGLAAFNRLDHSLLYLPMVAVLLWEMPFKKAVLHAIAGALPLLLWEIFSVVYYGFPIPNTAYAKLNVDIPISEMLGQGLRYCEYSLIRDPITPTVLLLGIASAFPFKDRRMTGTALGLLLYMSYIIGIGGDFMGGRFFSLPVFVAVFVIATRIPRILSFENRYIFTVALVVVAAIPWVAPNHPLATTAAFAERRLFFGIADERGFYFFTSGLANVLKVQVPFSKDPYYKKALDVIHRARKKKAEPTNPFVTFSPNVGIFGFTVGPSVHVVDSYALVDPLLSHLTAPYTTNWRIGHFRRKAPEGYRKTLSSGRNRIEDPTVATYYEQLRSIVRADIWLWSRWRAIVRVNLGLNVPTRVDRRDTDVQKGRKSIR